MRERGGDTGGFDLMHLTWDKKDLERRLCHALDIAERTVERLATKGYADPREPNDSVCPEKIVSETALLLLAAEKASAKSEAVKSRLRNVARLLIPHARSERIYLGVCLKPALALDFASAHICLTRLGYPDAAFGALLRSAVKAQARRGHERVPYRMLEQEWLLENWSSGPDSRRGHGSAAGESVLKFPMDLLDGSRDDVYAFTHALMFATDFNIKPGRLPRRRVEILAEAEAALARCIDEEDYDLGGEVLLAWPLTGKTWSAAAAFGFRILARVEDQAGFLPAPITRLQRLDELEGDRRTDYLFATAYHTIYVMGLLCAAALPAGRTPPSMIPAGTAMRGSSTKILDMLDADGKHTHWRSEFDQLTSAERDALAGFLMNIALRRKTRQRDFGAVARLLRDGHAMGLTDTPAASQAAEMLERVSVFAESTRLQLSA
jgi:hypothetical protein